MYFKRDEGDVNVSKFTPGNERDILDQTCLGPFQGINGRINSKTKPSGRFPGTENNKINITRTS